MRNAPLHAATQPPPDELRAAVAVIEIFSQRKTVLQCSAHRHDHKAVLLLRHPTGCLPAVPPLSFSRLRLRRALTLSLSRARAFCTAFSVVLRRLAVPLPCRRTAAGLTLEPLAAPNRNTRKSMTSATEAGASACAVWPPAGGEAKAHCDIVVSREVQCIASG